MFKITKQVMYLAILVLVALAAGAVYFFSNYSVKKVNAGDSVTVVQKLPKDFAIIRKDKDLTPQEAAQKAIDYANKTMLTPPTQAVLEGVSEQNGLYAFKLKVDNQEYESYVTKNGKMMFISGVTIDDKPASTTGTDATKPPVTVTKSDKPDVMLFVMSYCPYGLQAEKMYLPVYDLLKNKANINIDFVNYSMHGKKEVDENLRQYCIQKEQTDKYPAYLKCFVETTNCGQYPSGDCAVDFASCLTKTGIDKTKLDACTAAADKQFNVTADYNDKTKWVSGQFPKVELNDDLNTKYNVGGSPTIIINGAEANVASRSPEAFKKAICDAFNTQPDECKTTLSSDVTKDGFGTGAAAAGTTSGGGCGN